MRPGRCWCGTNLWTRPRGSWTCLHCGTTHQADDAKGGQHEVGAPGDPGGGGDLRRGGMAVRSEGGMSDIVITLLLGAASGVAIGVLLVLDGLF